MRNRKPVLFAAATVLVFGLAAIPAGAATVGPLTLVSGPSPYAGCTIGGPGTNYPNAEVEPWVSVSPVNSQNIIGVWQQDRWSNGGAHGLLTAVSFDGGVSWSPRSAPLSRCTGGSAASRLSPAGGPPST